MTVTLILGLQWGDEGKGKIVDLLAGDYDYIVRFNGGDNAGHTVKKGDEEFKLHLVPSGVFYPEKMKVIANGTVVNLDTLVGEMEEAEKRGYHMKNLILSSCAHIILPWHRMMDGGLDKVGKIGTTKKGIGPAYSDKASRTFALRAGDLLLPEDELKKKMALIASHKKKIFKALELPEFDEAAITAKTIENAKKVRSHIADTQALLNNALDGGKSMLFEGAHGSLLDIDHGTFPYVTSSNTISGGGCTGAGIPPQSIRRVIGIAKAYTTRVGEGPFPTELDDAVGEKLREKGHEFGTTTGRPRRCGWLDLVLLKYTCMINGVTDIAFTKLDVLDGLEELKVCTAYELDGKRITDFPPDSHRLSRVKPVYESLPGWEEDISGAKKREDLPEAAKSYLDFVEKKLSVPLKIISVGPKREETI